MVKVSQWSLFDTNYKTNTNSKTDANGKTNTNVGGNFYGYDTNNLLTEFDPSYKSINQVPTTEATSNIIGKNISGKNPVWDWQTRVEVPLEVLQNLRDKSKIWNWWAARNNTNTTSNTTSNTTTNNRLPDNSTKNTETSNNKENIEKVDVVEGEVVNPKAATSSRVMNRLKTIWKIGWGLWLIWLWYELASGGNTWPEQSGGNSDGSNNSGGSNSSSGSGRTPITATDYPEIVRQVIRGEFGNGQARKNALAQAGYDYNQVQSLVNDAMARRPYNGTQITGPQTQTQTQEQTGYVDPTGQWHEGMSQQHFNQAYITWQEDVFRSRRNEMMSGWKSADEFFWETLNKANENPEAYTEQQMDALRQLAMRLGYMDEKGNFAQKNQDGSYWFAINMDFANQNPQYQQSVTGTDTVQPVAYNSRYYYESWHQPAYGAMNNGWHWSDINNPTSPFYTTQGWTSGAYDRFYL